MDRQGEWSDRILFGSVLPKSTSSFPGEEDLETAGQEMSPGFMYYLLQLDSLAAPFQNSQHIMCTHVKNNNWFKLTTLFHTIQGSIQYYIVVISWT